MTLRIKDYKDGIQFSGLIHPRSVNNKICGLQDEYLKIRITSPPVDGRQIKFVLNF